MRTVYKLYQYQDGDQLSCNFVSDLRNDPVVNQYGWIYGPVATCSPTTSWMSCTSQVDEFDWNAGFEDDSADVQVEVLNNTFNPSTNACLAVDLDLTWLLYAYDL